MYAMTSSESFFFSELFLYLSRDFASGNIEVEGKQNSLFPEGPVIKCLTVWVTKEITDYFLSLLKETIIKQE